MKTRKLRLAPIEKILYTAAIVLTLAFPFGLVSYQSQMNELNIEVQELTRYVNMQERVNESISMKISMLASLENIEDQARLAGLQINNDNIKSIR
jgi:cell division protein FtsL